MRKRVYLVVAVVALALVAQSLFASLQGAQQPAFNGQRALADIEYQLALGPRTPGSAAHANTVEWMLRSLRAAGWAAEVQDTEWLGQPVRNVIAKRGAGEPWLILGAHYDSRLSADFDPDPAAHAHPVPGANDGASGVAVLLELARVLPPDLPGQIWLVFFDAEDNGRIAGWDWIMGSRAFAQSLSEHPDAVIILDMIGDTDLQVYYEANSDESLRAEIWDTAAELGYADLFIPSVRHSMLDDHTPFIELGIPSVLLIDFDYPYWHTRQDTLDKVSAHSLQAVGDTMLAWLLGRTD
ncbi:MAG: M28 family peptidase [Anaerolineales bacterium]|nr:M28 family peptidase [Anaerolineales bacterium]MCW5856211.1 M28 family peptidase [Anaerolineales bacterium]